MELINWLQRLRETRRSRSNRRDVSRKLYQQIVTQARQPSFYSVAKVSDSVDGRFELIVLHLFILLRCFRHDPITASISQGLVNAMTEDMDRALRELGVGDLKIGRKVRTMVGIMHVRLSSYEVALEGEDEMLSKVLSDSFCSERVTAFDTDVELMKIYVRRAIEGISRLPCRDLIQGDIVFPQLIKNTNRGCSRGDD
jgi:cytochrome b pre-mRNA-processing protein 3